MEFLLVIMLSASPAGYEDSLVHRFEASASFSYLQVSGKERCESMGAMLSTEQAAKARTVNPALSWSARHECRPMPGSKTEDR